MTNIKLSPEAEKEKCETRENHPRLCDISDLDESGAWRAGYNDGFDAGYAFAKTEEQTSTAEFNATITELNRVNADLHADIERVLRHQADGFEKQIEQLLAEIATLKAKLWVAKDSQLRTYDGLAQKADRADELEAKLAVAVEALKYVCRVTYGTELSNTEEENNEILAIHFFNSAEKAHEALEKIMGKL